MAATTLVESLLKAVAQRTALRLSVDSGAEPRVHIARAIKLASEDPVDGIWVHLPDAGGGTALSELTQAASCIGWFCQDGARYAFDTRVLKRDKHFWVNDDVMFDALLLAGPEELREEDVRSAERYTVSEGSGVSAQLFRMTPVSNPGKKLEAIPVPGRLFDLSLTGAGFWCGYDPALAKLRPGEPLALVLQFRGDRIPLLAKLMHIDRVTDRTVRIGLSITLSPATAPGRVRALEQVIEELQRQQALRQPRQLQTV
jgi:hypothetical protein